MIATLALAVALFVDDPEVARIRAHLTRVEAELRAADVSPLAPRARETRAHLLDVLHDYRERGVFPHNHDFPEGRRPYFIDPHGTRCAVAHLIEVSGGGALVARVAATGNNAYVAELAGDPELIAWLARSGFTAEEAGRIQPTYAYDVGMPCSDDMMCRSQLCRPALDDPWNLFCTRSCTPGEPDPCPVVDGVAMECLPTLAGDATQCAYPPPTPRLAGWPCEVNDDCLNWSCLPPAEGGVCTHPCFSAADCPPSFICGSTPSYETTMCLPAPPAQDAESSGCAVATTPRRASPWLLLWILALVALVISLRSDPR